LTKSPATREVHGKLVASSAVDAAGQWELSLQAKENIKRVFQNVHPALLPLPLANVLK